MKLLIIGVSSILGPAPFKAARQKSDMEVNGTVRRRIRRILEFLQTEETRIFECDLEVAVDPLLYCSPDIVINCPGTIMQNGTAQTTLSYFRVNALAPYILAEMCEHRGPRLIHASADCVFSGGVGHYSERDIPDPVNLYDRSKLLGDVTHAPHLTIRTSFIGLNRFHHQVLSLLNWFIRQSGEIEGYTRAIWSRLTTLEVSRNLVLLAGRQEVFDNPSVVIRPNGKHVYDRSLSSSPPSQLGVTVPGLRQMLVEWCNLK